MGKMVDYMPEFISNLQQKIKDLWKNLDKSQKSRVLLISAILVIAITVSIVILTRTTYVPLVTIDDTKDAAEIEKVLQDRGISYKPGEGNKIMVDERDKNKAEFALASSGITSSGMNFEDAWNLVSITSTESDKKQLWQNFKKNSLVAKLKMFDNVRDADVEVTMPENTLFFSEKSSNKPTAFVRIDPKGDISQEQVKGIVSVVSASIEGLDPNDVTVVDNNFNILSTDMSNSIGDTSTQYKMKLKVKEELEKNIRVLYPSKSDSYDYISVVVNPVLEFDKQKTTKKEVGKPTDIDEAVVSNHTEKEELVNGSQGGIPGTDTNPGDGTTTYPIEGGENSTYKKTTNDINRIFNETMTEIEKSQGNINFENSSVAVTLWYGQSVADDSSLTPEFLTQCQQVISGATNIPVSKISINKYKLAPVEESKEAVADKIKEYIDAYGYFALMLMLIVGLMIAVIPRKKKEEDVVTEENLAPELATAGGPQFIVPEAEEPIPEISFEERSEVKKQIEKFVKEKPESVAQLLRNWLSDEWD